MAAYRAGKSAYETGDYKEAATALRWAAGLDPDNPIYSHAAALSAAKAGARDQAERLFMRALAAIQRTLGESHPFTLIVARDMAMYRGTNGETEPSLEALARRVVARADPCAIARSGDRTLQALAELCVLAGKPSLATPLFEAALEYRRSQHGCGHAKAHFCSSALAGLRSEGAVDENPGDDLARDSGGGIRIR